MTKAIEASQTKMLHVMDQKLDARLGTLGYRRQRKPKKKKKRGKKERGTNQKKKKKRGNTTSIVLNKYSHPPKK